MKVMFLIALFTYFSTLLGLSLYSFTQMDSDVFPLFNSFSSFGINQRFLSGSIFLLVLFSLSALYFYFLQHPPKHLWLIIIASAIITFPAFPAAFSRDVYNYAMDAKTLVVYHQNPWTTPPKAHPNEELLLHIHWPNDPTRYGPAWVLPTAAVYSVWPSLYAFKLFTLSVWLGTLFLVSKLLHPAKLQRSGALAFLAFNPLLIIEYYIGTHTDITMTFFIILSLYFLQQKKFRLSWSSFILSVAVKITSLPEAVALWLAQTFRLSFKSTVFLLIWFAYLGALIIIAKWSINPWYFSLPIVLSALFLQSKFHKFLAISLSLAAVVRYLPLLYLGPFDPHNKIRAFLFLIFLVPFVISLFLPGKSSSRLSR